MISGGGVPNALENWVQVSIVSTVFRAALSSKVMNPSPFQTRVRTSVVMAAANNCSARILTNMKAIAPTRA